MPWSRRLEGVVLALFWRQSPWPHVGRSARVCLAGWRNRSLLRGDNRSRHDPHVVHSADAEHSLASASSRVVWLNGALLDHFVDDAEIPRRLRSEEIGALERVLDFLQRLAGVTDVDLIEALLEV